MILAWLAQNHMFALLLTHQLWPTSADVRTNSIRGALQPWTEKLQELFPALEIQRAKLDRHPLQRM